jgi:hypothetical protein
MDKKLRILIADAVGRIRNQDGGSTQTAREPETRTMETFKSQTKRVLGTEVLEAIAPVVFYHCEGWLNETMSFAGGGYNFWMNRQAHQFVTLKKDGHLREAFVELDLDNPKFKYHFLGALGTVLDGDRAT